MDVDEFMEANGKQENWNENEHRIVYTSRTHSQLAQVMKEMKFTNYSDLNGIALGSRDQLCINDEVMKAATTSEKINLCRAKVKAKQCSYYSHVDRCVDLPRTQTVLDIEDLIKTGKSCGACPYFLAKKLSENADIVFLPYNYILDFRLLKSFKFKMRNAIVIFDEAHNVERVCQDAASYQLSSTDIASSIEDVTHVMKSLEESQANVSIFGENEKEVDISPNDCAILKEILLDFERQVDGIEQVTEKDGRTLPGDKIFDFLQAANITLESSTLIIQQINSLNEYLTQISAGKSFGRKGYGLAKIAEFLEIVFGFKIGEKDNWRKTVEIAYRLHVELEEQKKPMRRAPAANDGWHNTTNNQTTTSSKAKVLNYWCFNPGLGMIGLMNRDIHSIILTSGTLSPIKPLVAELALNAECQLENGHIVKPSQVFCKIISNGPDGTPLNAGFHNRENLKYYQSLAYTIKTIATKTPNGLLIFFPSYILMNKTKELWQRNNMWDAIHDVKPIFMEPQNKNDFETCMSEYYAAVQTTRGAIFMAVLRGKVSEGLDFKDENGRAVIIIGLPFAPYKNPQIILKREYLEKNRNKGNMLVSGQEWYDTDAIRAVNQAIGRVIRHKDDYGAILLCDERFSRYKTGLSKWVQSHLQTKYNEKFTFGPIIRDLGKFFCNASSAEICGNVNNSTRIAQNNSYRNVKVERENNQIEEKVNSMIKQQTRLENSNELYTTKNSLKAEDLKRIEEFVKREEKATPSSIFSDNVNNTGASSIDFNALASFQVSTATKSSFSTSTITQEITSQSSTTASHPPPSKKRKFKVSRNEEQKPKFVYSKEPVKVKQELYERQVPDERKEFLDMVSIIHFN
jgi:regulator of telomere elongation helicase 1